MLWALARSHIFCLYLQIWSPFLKIWRWHSRMASNAKLALLFTAPCLVLDGCIPRLMIITVAVSNKAPPHFSCEKFGGVFFADVEREIPGKRGGLSKCSCGKWGIHLAVDTLGWFLHSLRRRWGNGGVWTSSRGAQTLQQLHFVFAGIHSWCIPSLLYFFWNSVQIHYSFNQLHYLSLCIDEAFSVTVYCLFILCGI